MTQTPNEGRVPEPPTGRRGDSRGGATPSRVGSLWVASILFAVVLLLLLIFVLQNGQDAKISYLGAHGSLPQGVALLLAAVFGILLVALPGTARIIQLRIRDRRHRGAARTRPQVDAGPAVISGTGSGAGTTAAPPTAGRPTDAGPTDAGPTDAGATDAQATDAGATDAQSTDAPSTTAPATPVASPSGPSAQPPPAEAR